MTEIRNAIIESVQLTKGDHNLLSAWIHLNYGGAGQGFGGYALYLPDTFLHHKDSHANFAGHFIFRVLEIAGVDEWDDLPGKTVRVKASLDKVHAIGHIVKDDWFDPGDEFKMMENHIEAKP